MPWRWLFAGLLVALAIAGYGLYARWWNLPPQYDPWADLSITEEPGLLTRYKLRRVSGDPALCLRVLATAEMKWEAVADRDTGKDCSQRDAVRISATRLRLSDSFVLTCPAAVSLAMWEQHNVLRAAAAHLGEPLLRLDHLGSYACRNVGNAQEGRRSQHATAEALDVQGFTLRGGRRIAVQRFWDGDTPESRFLHDVRDGACRFFDGVLGPEYNAAHRDHLHLDRGPYRVCR